MNKPDQELITREPFVAGQFYPADPTELRKEINEFFTEAEPKKTDKDVLAVICPHAGYVFSGIVAASSYHQIDPDKEYNNIFLIGSSHHYTFDGASVFTEGNYKTPLGVVPVNIELGKKLLKDFHCFMNREDAQLYEHSLEVQLPYLQYYMKKPFRIVPIILGTQNVSTCKKIAEALQPYFNSSNLFIISTDFSHYPDYEDAKIVDKHTADALITGKPDALLKALNDNAVRDIENLATSMCGWTSVLTLLYMTKNMPAIHYIPVEYMNSGDSKLYGDKTRVVGYYSIAVISDSITKTNVKTDTSFSLSKEDKKELLGIARTTIEIYVTKREVPKINTSGFSINLKAPVGAFVTLTENGRLRGCIGRFNPNIPLYQVVQDMAVSAATQDYRFAPVKSSELPDIEIEISVLTPLKRISSPDEIIMGKQGIYIKKGINTGTFLPQVANSTGWTKEEFLGHCAQDKAGIGWNGWKDAELYTYEAIVFHE